ncbi:MAG: lipopolysaccharide heptosyltransferase I [Pseudomonadales bacterium]
MLIIKMSSLGDVVHTLPAITDLAAQGAEIHWVVEEAFVPIVAAHPGVARILPIAWRRWRRQLPKFWQRQAGAAGRELAAFRWQLKDTQYDLVIDAQGLYKSAIVARQAHSARRLGLDRDSAREPGAARFYSEGVAVAKDQHAVDRVRQLVAQAAGYELPTQLRFGLHDEQAQRQPASANTCVLLHGTTWASKHYPEQLWIELAQHASAAGFQPVLTWGDAVEERRAQRIAAASGASLWPRMSLTELIQRLRTATVAIGVDSGIAHLCGALGVPTLGLYGATNATLTGVRGAHSQNMAAEFACAPCVRRDCGYTGPQVLHNAAAVEPACFGQLLPASVWRAASELAAG